MPVTIETDAAGAELFIAVEGDVDLYSSPELRKAVMKAVKRAEDAVAVDLQAVTYMDSSGVATLVEGLRAAKKRDLGFVLVAPSQAVMKVLELARLDSVFEVRAA